MTPDDILEFWFEDCAPTDWWHKSAPFDAALKARFEAIWQDAAAGALWEWRATGLGRLAEIIILDQFPRNMFRDTAQAFASDALALVLAQEAVAQGIGRDWSEQNHRQFLLMPYMHSEHPRVHEEAVRLFTLYDLPDNLDFELRHKAIIDRFGRYPHRNTALGRESTPEELAFLDEPGSSF